MEPVGRGEVEMRCSQAYARIVVSQAEGNVLLVLEKGVRAQGGEMRRTNSFLTMFANLIVSALVSSMRV